MQEVNTSQSTEADFERAATALLTKRVERSKSGLVRESMEASAAVVGPAPVTAAPGPRTHSLPKLATSLLGRGADMAELKQLLSSHRVVTALGPGGVGKTSLAIGLGQDCLSEYEGGVWFCDLTEARDRDGVISAIAAGLGVNLSPRSPLPHLLATMSLRGSALFIFDNCEQVSNDVAELVPSMLEAATQCRILLTSRVTLDIPGEVRYDVGPLSVPSMKLEAAPVRKARAGKVGPTPIPLEIAESPAVQCFVERAAKADSEFRLTADNAPVIAAIVRRLDGIPLAVTLAAARVGSLTPSEMLDRLDARDGILEPTTDAPEGRRASLSATIRWSWDLLEPWEQSALAQLSAFRGGFTARACSEVLDQTDWPNHVSADTILRSLHSKSLLTIASGMKSTLRYTMLETIRAFASACLGQMPSSDESEASLESHTHRRHWEYFAHYGDPFRYANSPLTASRKPDADEVENVIAAFHRAREAGDMFHAGRLGTAALDMLQLIHNSARSRALMDAVEVIPPDCVESAVWRCAVLGDISSVTVGLASYEAYAEQALAAAKQSKDPRFLALGYWSITWFNTMAARHEKTLEASSKMLDAIITANYGRSMIVHAKRTKAHPLFLLGRTAEAERELREIEQIADPVEDRAQLILTTSDWALLKLYSWEIREALRYEMICASEASGLIPIDTLFKQAIVHRVLGEVREAEALLSSYRELQRLAGSAMRMYLAECHLRTVGFQSLGFSPEGEQALTQNLAKAGASTPYFSSGAPLYALAAWSAMSRGELALGLDYLARAEEGERQTGHPLAPVRQAAAFYAMRNGDFATARESVRAGRKAAAFDPDDGIPLIALQQQVEVEAVLAGDAGERAPELLETAREKYAELAAFMKREEIGPQSLIGMAFGQLRVAIEAAKHL